LVAAVASGDNDRGAHTGMGHNPYQTGAENGIHTGAVPRIRRQQREHPMQHHQPHLRRPAEAGRCRADPRRPSGEAQREAGLAPQHRRFAEAACSGQQFAEPMRLSRRAWLEK